MNMMQQLYASNPFLSSHPWTVGVFALAIVWSLFWKGFALWRSARREEHAWFIAILLVNTLGVLEILYLFVFAREKHG